MEIGKEMCLYHLWNQLEPECRREQALEFFCRTCRACGLDEKMAESLMYIQASYGLWDKEPVSGTEISSYMNRLNQNDSSCSDILKDYEHYHIQDVCALCPHSQIYKNRHDKEEITVLRRLLSDFEACCRGGKSIFTGMVRLAPDYAIGVYPVIPLRSYMYNYLLSFGMAAIDHTSTDFCGNFSNFLIQKALPHDLKGVAVDPDTVKMVVMKEYNHILTVPLESILPDVFDKYVRKLKQALTTTKAHKEKKPASIVGCGDPSSRPNGQLDLLDEMMSSYKSTDDTVSQDCPKTSNASQMQSSAETSDSDLTKDVLPDMAAGESIFSDLSNSTENPDDVTDDMPEEDTVQDITPSSALDVCLPEKMTDHEEVPETETEDTGSNQIPDPEKNPIISAETAPIAPEPPSMPHIQHDPFLLHIPEEWFGEELHIFSRQGSGYLQWITGAWQSPFICIETVCRYGRDGLIIYLSDTDLFYYLDLEANGDVLKSLLSDGECTALTAHTSDVYGLLYRYGYDHPQIHGLDILAGTLRIGENLTDDIRPLAHRMKEYPSLYQELCSILDTSMEIRYSDNLQILAVLAHSFFLSGLCPQMPACPIVPVGFMRFNYSFLPQYTWNENGVLFRITIPGLKPDILSSDALSGQILRIFDKLHHTYRKRSYPLAFYDQSFFFFYHGRHKEAMLFYDAFLIDLMELYEKLMNRPLHSQSFCVVWKTEESEV